ncbi:MAG: neutral/alkaline non-lysosomal ceramidase N-terminal domain-containing protein [Chloroflexi bacterium]|nr:neutral/alkaline non-lysosomal ceramidase N-terminal domain-containing protein [Chloroflexota bacterium]
MRAGVAKVCITPPVGTWQGGYGARTRPCEGVHDDLYARALVFAEGGGGAGAGSRVAIASADLVGLDRDSVQRVRRRVQELTGGPSGGRAIAPERVLIVTSHTHGGPSTLDLARADDGSAPSQLADPDYLVVAEKAIAGAVAFAARDLRPATLFLGEGSAGFHVNRRLPTLAGMAMRPNPNGVADRRVGVLRVAHASAPDGPPLAVVFHLACHATAVGGQNYSITADWPGAAAAFVEQAYGGDGGASPHGTQPATVALFLPGCGGNVRPNFATPEGRFRSATWEELASLGRTLGGEIVRAAEQAAPLDGVAGAGDLGAAAVNVRLPFATLPDRATLEMEAGGSGRDRTWAQALRRRLEAGGLPPDVEAEVQVLKLGALRLAAMPGEVFVEIGLHVRQALGEPSWALGYANGVYLGYVPTAAALVEGGYEPGAYRYFHYPAPLGPQTEDRLVEAAQQAARALGA